MAMMRLEEPSSRELGSSWGPRRGLSARVAMVLTFALPCAARVSPACGPVPPQREERLSSLTTRPRRARAKLTRRTCVEAF